MKGIPTIEHGCVGGLGQNSATIGDLGTCGQSATVLTSPMTGDPLGLAGPPRSGRATIAGVIEAQREEGVCSGRANLWGEGEMGRVTQIFDKALQPGAEIGW